MNVTNEIDGLRKAMKGFGTDEAALIRILSKPDPLQMMAIRQGYRQRHNRDIEKDIESETSGYFRDTLLSLVRGPLRNDVQAVHDAMAGMGTKEDIMNEVLLGRSNADINAIKQEYQKTYRKSLESDVKGDLSMKTERLFDMVLAARRAKESAPVVPQQIDQDVSEVYRATEGKAGTDQVLKSPSEPHRIRTANLFSQITVCQILSSRSDNQLRAIAHAYEQKYRHPLEKVLKSEFSGHMEDALLYMIRAATDRAKNDATLLEESMAGMGTKDVRLIYRVVRVHWNAQHLQQVKGAYKHHFKKDLATRIRGETRGDYEKLLVACIGG